MAGEIYRSAYTLNKFMKENVTTKKNQFVWLGYYQIQAGEIVSLGFGSQSGQATANGRIYMDLVDEEGNSLDGKIRFTVYSPQDRPMRILSEFEVATLRQNENDRTKQIAFPEDPHWLTEDRKLVIEFMCDKDATVDHEKSKLLMDVTQGVV